MFYFKNRDTFSEGGTTFLLVFFLSVTDFVLILLELLLGIVRSVECSRVDLGIDMVVFLGR